MEVVAETVFYLCITNLEVLLANFKALMTINLLLKLNPSRL